MENPMYPDVLVSGNGSIKVAAVGDSLTYGYGLENRLIEAYPSILAEMLGSHYQVMNFGLSGRSLLSTSDYPYLKEKNALLSLESHPDIVLLMLGSNDTRPFYWDEEAFIREYGELISLYQDLPSQPDVVAIVPPFVPTSRFGLNNVIVRDNLQVIIPMIAEKMGVSVINLYPVTEHHLDYYSDGLHLNVMGNQQIAKKIFSFLRA